MRTVFEPRPRRGFRHNASLLTRSARRAVALLAAAALLNLAPGASAAPATHAAPPTHATAAPAPSGQVTAAAGLTLDGSPVVQGQTVFPGSHVTTAEDTRPSLVLGNLARLELSGGTSLRLDFSAASVGGSLEEGGTRVYAPRGVAASLTTADAAVVSDAEAGPALFSLQVSEEGTTLSVQTGLVEMRAGGRALTAAAGQTLRAAHGSAPEPAAPPQGNNLSGKRKAGLFVGIAAAIAAIIIIIAAQDNDVELPPEIPCPIPNISPNFPGPPGC